MGFGLSPKARRNLLRLLPFPLIWLALSQLFLISDWAASSGFSTVPQDAIQLSAPIYLFATVAVVTVGLLVGVVELFFLNRRFTSRSLAEKLVGKTAFYAALITAVMVVAFPIAASIETGASLVDAEVWARLWRFMFSAGGIGTAVQLAASLFASIFYSEISEHMGPQVLASFLTGRYHRPRSERRVFLFSDMKSSTRIAEELGHERYFEFLREYYDALSDAIVDSGGEVYQYVGDEIVVSWPERVGLRDTGCVRCVLDMKADLRERRDPFLERFGWAPDFKAGLQLGDVTTGEIGALKKEIVFSGDVLNQTARIQGLCAETGEDILLGDELARRLSPPGEWRLRSLGRRVLRGKHRDVEVFALEPTGAATDLDEGLLERGGVTSRDGSSTESLG